MISLFRSKWPGVAFFITLIFMVFAGPALAVETNATETADGKTTETGAIITNDSLRSYLQIQEQLHNTQLALEKNRKEAEFAASSNSLALEERLKIMEKTFANERLEELRGIERSDRMILMAAGAFAGVGFLVLLLAAFMQWTSINRLSASATRLTAMETRRPFGVADGQMPQECAIEESTSRFLGLIDRLENRIHQLEGTVKPPQSLPETTPGNGDAVKPFESGNLKAMGPDNAVNVLLIKGQTLLKLDKPDEALVCLDEILSLDPANAEALVKKGAALERLQRFDEAVACYDRAIAHDSSMTMAYLYKGGVFNRLERYTEALACYEQALKTRQNGHAANVIVE